MTDMRDQLQELLELPELLYPISPDITDDPAGGASPAAFVKARVALLTFTFRMQNP